MNIVNGESPNQDSNSKSAFVEIILLY